MAAQLSNLVSVDSQTAWKIIRLSSPTVQEDDADQPAASKGLSCGTQRLGRGRGRDMIQHLLLCLPCSVRRLPHRLRVAVLATVGLFLLSPPRGAEGM